MTAKNLKITSKEMTISNNEHFLIFSGFDLKKWID